MATEQRSHSTLWWVLFLFRIAIVVLLLYWIDGTPLAGHRIIAYFHLGRVASWFLALAMILILWRVAEWILGIVLIVVTGVSLLVDTIKTKNG
jgi:hypothetical protein